jgi:hypothetical protein
MQPYFYKILHKPSGKYYVGSQYGKLSDSNKLWKSYYTSSKYVRKLIESDGLDSFTVVSIIKRDDARDYERRYLKKVYGIMGKNRFLEVFLNRNIAPGILLTEEMIKKANIKRSVSNSLSAKKLIEEGRHNFQKTNASDFEHVRKMRSERMMGNMYGCKRNITDELKKKLSEKSKGNTNVRGTKWWTDGTINRRSKNCPGINFILGTTKK